MSKMAVIMILVVLFVGILFDNSLKNFQKQLEQNENNRTNTILDQIENIDDLDNKNSQ